MHEEIKRKKQNLGIFYTDQRIVDFIFEILKTWKEKENKEIGRWESRKHFPSVIDPAVGEGVFLKTAIKTGFTKTDYIFGLDIDEEAVKKWKQINLLKEFGGKEEDLEAHFFHQNGLDRIHWEQHKNKYQHKLKQKDINIQQFDAVIGNPPYGGVGLGETELTNDLMIRLADFEILSENVKNNLIIANTQKNLFNSDKQLAIKSDAKQKIKSFSIEILFLERFIQLAKPGGWIAIIIPDGILANSNSHYVREFISKKTKVEAIISLPRDAFKSVGTSAKTSILFLQKYKDQEKEQNNYPVFLASVESLDEKNFNLVKDNYKNYYNKTMSNKNLVQITTDENGQEIVMVRVDKTLKELMEEKPASRWDTGYWHPKFGLGDFTKFEIKPLNDFIEHITYGQVGRREFVKKTPDTKRYLAAKNFIPTGIDWTLKENYIKIGGWNDPERSKPKIDDVLLIGVGVATTGRVAIVHKIEDDFNFGQDVKLIRLNKKRINPYYVCLFLKSFFGQSQINRLKTGVGTLNLDFDEIKSIKIPLIPNKIQEHIEIEYKKVFAYHDKAMESKKNNREAEYKKDIEIAEKMLKDLITKTEAVIRGEKRDVI